MARMTYHLIDPQNHRRLSVQAPNAALGRARLWWQWYRRPLSRRMLGDRRLFFHECRIRESCKPRKAVAHG